MIDLGVVGLGICIALASDLFLHGRLCRLGICMYFLLTMYGFHQLSR